VLQLAAKAQQQHHMTRTTASVANQHQLFLFVVAQCVDWLFRTVGLSE
jgi:hypothetical protein